ncbi:MAG: U32 family peptidase [Enterocloster asparagiformis]|nr:U32 family peptidase [Enterocloster asparagiformis]
MKAAVAAGADAVYMGGSRFGARAYADNPDEHGLLEAIDYVHLHGRRLYMTVNTLFKEDEMGELYPYLLPYYREGLDAVIVQDLGAMDFMRRNFPGIDLHASTQMTITGVNGARLLKELGAARVVTARELSLDEIRQIRDQVDVEIESFVHGALCYCYSGQCLMSSLIGGRSGNRGRCAQPCRLPYEARESGKKPGEALNRKQEPNVMSLKDLCTLDLIPDLAAAGIYSLKIEGRMKSPRYTAGVVSIYRKYVDRYLEYGADGYFVEPEDKKLLSDLFDRGGFTQGYYKQHNGRDMVALKEKPSFREGNQKLFDYLDKTYVEAELKEAISGQAVLEEGKPSGLELSMASSHGGVPVRIRVEGQSPQKAQNQPLTVEKVRKQLEKTGNTPFAFEALDVELKGQLFMPVQAQNELRRAGLEALEQAVLDQWRRPEPAMAENVTPPESKAMAENVTSPESKAMPENVAPPESKAMSENVALPDCEALPEASARPASRPSALALYVFTEEPNQFEAAVLDADVTGIYLDAAGFVPERWADAVKSCHGAGKQCLLALPHIYRSHAQAFFKQNGKKLRDAGFDGALVRSPEEVVWLRETLPGLPAVFDAGMYCWNRETAKLFAKLGAARLTMPWELNSRELEPVMDGLLRQGIQGELVVYGRIPMMVSAQCIRRTTTGCTRRREVLTLKDRTGALLPVKNHCAFCYNTIYNASPLSLLGLESAVKRLGPAVVRLNFTTEGREETARIIRAFADGFLRGQEVPQPYKDFTRGHFKRGVQ